MSFTQKCQSRVKFNIIKNVISYYIILLELRSVASITHLKNIQGISYNWLSLLHPTCLNLSQLNKTYLEPNQSKLTIKNYYFSPFRPNYIKFLFMYITHIIDVLDN